MFGKDKKTVKKVKTNSMKVVQSKAKSADKLSRELKSLNTHKELKVGRQYVAKNKDGTYTVRTPYKGTNTYSHNWNASSITNSLTKSDYFEDVKRNLKPRQYSIRRTPIRKVSSKTKGKAW